MSTTYVCSQGEGGLMWTGGESQKPDFIVDIING